MISFVYSMILLYTIIALFVFYSLLVLYYCWAWRSVPEYRATSSIQQTRISIIIPARNEEKNIGALLDSLQQQTYPKELTEIIVVDDNSSDQTVIVIHQYPGIKLLQLKEDAINSYKKKAIETGIAASSGELVVTTDADCIVGPEWLRTIVDRYTSKSAVFV